MHQRILVVILFFLFSPAAFGGATAFGPDDPQGVSATEKFDSNGQPTGDIIVEGTISNVRFTADDVQQIGCRLRGNVSGDLSALCTAVDITEASYSCFSREPAIIEVVKSISPYSFVRFEMLGPLLGPGEQTIRLCSDLVVSTRSVHIPDSNVEKSKTPK